MGIYNKYALYLIFFSLQLFQWFNLISFSNANGTEVIFLKFVSSNVRK